MTRRKSASAARKPGAAKIPYPEIRDRFIAHNDTTSDEQRLMLLAEIGAFVLDRWEAEEVERVEGQPLDEQACWSMWDEVTEKQFQSLRSSAAELVARETKRRRIRAFTSDWLEQQATLANLWRGLSWALMRAWEHFIGAFGLLLFGLLIVWGAPHLAKTIRSALDETLPQDTRPAGLQEPVGGKGETR